MSVPSYLRSINGLPERLRQSIQGYGDLASVSELTGISRSQLIRYLNGSPIPSDKLITLSKSLKISSAWLLGEEATIRDNFANMVDRTRVYCERLIRLLQRYTTTRALLPGEIGYVLELMLLSQQYNCPESGEINEYTDYDMQYGLHYLEGMRTNDWLEVYVEGCLKLNSQGLESFQPFWAHKWAAIIQDAFKKHYSSEPLVTDYFQRLNVIQMPSDTAHFQMMQRWLSFLITNLQMCKSIRVLDLGCGNGRHLIHMHQASDRFELKGIDTSIPALEICKAHEKLGRLPQGAVQEGDFLQIPYPEASFEVCMTITNLQFLPLIPGSIEVGVGRALAELCRVLKPGGYALLLVQVTTPDEFFPMFQFSHSERHILELFQKVGLKLIQRDPVQLKELGLPGSRYGRGVKYQDALIAQKV